MKTSLLALLAIVLLISGMVGCDRNPEANPPAMCTRCPRCGKIIDLSQGEICPYCLKNINETE